MAKHPRVLAKLVNRAVSPQIMSELTKQRALLDLVRSQLPAPVSKHCIASLYQSGRLIIYVDSSAFALQIRFHSQTLIKAIIDQTPLRPSEVQVRNRLIETTGSSPSSQKRTLRPGVTDHIRALRQALGEEPEEGR